MIINCTDYFDFDKISPKKKKSIFVFLVVQRRVVARSSNPGRVGPEQTATHHWSSSKTSLTFCRSFPLFLNQSTFPLRWTLLNFNICLFWTKAFLVTLSLSDEIPTIVCFWIQSAVFVSWGRLVCFWHNPGLFLSFLLISWFGEQREGAFSVIMWNRRWVFALLLCCLFYSRIEAFKFHRAQKTERISGNNLVSPSPFLAWMKFLRIGRFSC